MKKIKTKVLGVILSATLLASTMPFIAQAAPVPQSELKTKAQEYAANIADVAKASSFQPKALGKKIGSDKAVSAAMTPTPKFVRYGGKSRIDTAVLASKASFRPGYTPFVIVATSGTFPDALSAAPLAGYLGAPILLTDPGALSPATAKEISRLKASYAIVVGGTGSVSAKAYKSIVKLTGNGERIGGANRYEVSVLISATLCGIQDAIDGYHSDDMFIAKGSDFPDALSAASIAANIYTPIVLTESKSLSPEVRAYIKVVDPGYAYITGGTASVTLTVENALKKGGIKTKRYGGAGRYDVAAAVVKDWCIWTNLVGFASGAVFPDALTAAPSLANRSGVLLLTDTNSIPAPIATQAKRLRPKLTRVEVFGGTGTIPTKTENKIKSLLK